MSCQLLPQQEAALQVEGAVALQAAGLKLLRHKNNRRKVLGQLGSGQSEALQLLESTESRRGILRIRVGKRRSAEACAPAGSRLPDEPPAAAWPGSLQEQDKKRIFVLESFASEGALDDPEVAPSAAFFQRLQLGQALHGRGNGGICRRAGKRHLQGLEDQDHF